MGPPVTFMSTYEASVITHLALGHKPGYERTFADCQSHALSTRLTFLNMQQPKKTNMRNGVGISLFKSDFCSVIFQSLV